MLYYGKIEKKRRNLKIKHYNYSNKLEAFLKIDASKRFLKMARLLLVLIVNGNNFHKDHHFFFYDIPFYFTSK